jgi:hypothetical protein
MLRIIAALSLASMLGVAAVPAVAHDLDEDLFLDEEGNFVLVGELEGLEDLFDSRLLFDGDVEDLIGDVGQGSEQGDVESGDVQLPVIGGSSTGGNSTGGSIGSTVGQGFEQEDVESGDVEPSVNISNSGNNANLCPTVLQSANSGNVQNAQGVSQYNSTADDIEFEGSNITMAPEAAGSCDQTIRQSGAAGW